MCAMAATPSFQLIFLPSAYLRRWYVIGISVMRRRRFASYAVISGSMPNRSLRRDIPRRMSVGTTL